MHCFDQHVFVAGLKIGAQGLHTAAEITDAHGAGKGITVYFAECLYLHGAGEGYHGIGNQVPGVGEKSDSKQEQDFNR